MPRYEIFYDAACPMCRFEIHRLVRHDRQQQFSLQDISSPQFDAALYAGYGLEVAQMQALLHIRRDDGVILIGVDAIAALYRAIGSSWWTPALTGRFTRGTAVKLYAWIAKNRYRLSVWLGFTPSCRDGVCKL